MAEPEDATNTEQRLVVSNPGEHEGVSIEVREQIDLSANHREIVKVRARVGPNTIDEAYQCTGCGLIARTDADTWRLTCSEAK